METDTKRMRRDKPYVMTNLKTHTGVAEVVSFIQHKGMLLT
jgi:urease accessory protein